MTASNKPENQKPNGLHDLGQISQELLAELQAAHLILRNALALMSPAQKNAWGRKNEIDGLIEFGTTRSNERTERINKAIRMLNSKEAS